MIPVFDGHNDALTHPGHEALAQGRPGHIDLPKMRAGGIRGAIFAVWAGDHDGVMTGPATPLAQPDAQGGVRWDLPAAFDHEAAAALATRAAGRLAGLQRDGHVRIARSVDTLDAAHDDDGPPAAVLHLEGAEAIDPGLESLEHWYAAGLRSLGPVWSRPTAFGHGVPFTPHTSPDSGPGLTDAGRGLIARCAELGVLVDLAHLNEAGFWDVARAELGPLVSSHTAAHAIAPSPRNLTDAQLDAVGQSGGLVGIVYSVDFLSPECSSDPDISIELIARHAAYVAERIGPEHVGLGSDFDGCVIPTELGDATGVPRILDALAGAGFSADEVAAIAWSNWRRVLGAWWRHAS
jgi:membrane dipeptidase